MARKKTVVVPAAKKVTTTINYGVRRGDTIDTIAEKYGVTVEKLRKDNGIKEGDQLAGGQRLIITL